MLKRILRKIIKGYKADSESYIKYLKNKGVSIGEDVTIYSPETTHIDLTRPWMIKIGDSVKITHGVTILTHGYDWSVLKKVYSEVLGSAGEVIIGNNVFIGMHSTILKGVHIGENVIIGANSLVNRDIPDNCVAAGNPCRPVMKLDEYYKRRKAAQVKEAVELIQSYRERYSREPGINELREHFWLFSNNPDDLPECWKDVNKLMGNYEATCIKMKNHDIDYCSMEDFLKTIPWIKNND